MKVAEMEAALHEIDGIRDDYHREREDHLLKVMEKVCAHLDAAKYRAGKAQVLEDKIGALVSGNEVARGYLTAELRVVR